MTIGVAAYGEEAGRAVADGVLAAEILGRGAIGGFAVLSVLDETGAHRQLECQNGGVRALSGIENFYEARCAAVISSGPDRPEPLSQFLSAAASLGLVTGHRLPQRPNTDNIPFNASVLQRLAQGYSPFEAVNRELQENPEADFGLIALTADGRLGFGNSARVRRRGDLVEASHFEQGRGYALLANSIHFAHDVQPEVALGEVILSRLSGRAMGYSIARLSASVPVFSSGEDRIELHDDGRIARIYRADPWTPSHAAQTTVVYLGARVWQYGQPVGSCVSEVLARLEGGWASPDPLRQCHFVVRRN